jgi:signal transduction histidine kinase/ligand-binding sensor domain-containing protein/CheY-like chemotaxis protein/AraC-like DNA-binding protein
MFLFMRFNMLGKAGLSLMVFMLSLIAFQQIKGHGLKYHEFRPIDHRLGMDASAVNCVVQDNHGLIWLGTDRGLYSFDGYMARHYSARTHHAQGNGVVYCALMVDSVHIWLGTDNGLSVFNTFTDSYEPTPGDLPENIRAISRINDHSFWIGSINGLFRYDAATRKSEKISDKLLPHQAIYTILRYDDNTFYFGTYNGLCRFKTQTGKFEKVALGSSFRASNQLILSLLPDYSRNCIWVGVEGSLFAYDPSSGQSTAEPLFNGNSVKSLLLDNQNYLWAGTDNGLYIYEPATKKYRLIRHDAISDRSLLNNVVWSVFADREQNIWIGTDAGASLYIYNDHFRLQSISELTGSNEGNYIISLLADTKGNLWLGGNNGLIKVDKASGKTIWYQQNNSQYPLPHNKIRYVFEDMDGDIWIATDGSICRYNEKTLQFVRYQIEDVTHSRNANWSYAICQDETRKLWIATCLGGLFVVDKKELLASERKTFVAERNYFSNSGVQGLSGNMLQFLAIDGNRNVWTGTYRAGFNKIDRMNQKVVQFTTRSSDCSLTSDDVTAMTFDSDNFLWVALRNRLVRVDPVKHSMKMVADPRLNDAYINALTDDGKRIWMSLSSGLFFIDKATMKIKQINSGGNYYSSIFYDHRTHRMAAGGINEFVEFDPETILAEDQQNKLFITSLWINDKLVQDDSLQRLPFNLGQSIRFSRAIELPHNLNNLSFTFSELSYNQQQNVQYANKLDGLDADWHLSARGTNRITYNNLPPGDYTLMISRIGSDGIPMLHPLAFKIKIDHPWYSTWPAKCVYAALFLLLIIAIINYYMVLNRLRYERIEKVKTMELTAHKIDFLTNISHELKTPLSLMIGPLEKMIEQVKPATLKDQLAHVRQNALKMGSLIHQMMEASRQEFEGFGLIVSKTDVVAFVRSVVSAFEKPLGARSIRISVESELPSFFIEADVLKLEVILNNILSNASKFAPDGSVIKVTIEALNDLVKLKVTDEGPGINSRDLPHVFERFFQSRHSLSQNKEGSGVGLSIVKDYIQLHRGTVKVLSDGVKGTCVEIELPIVQMVGETEAPANPQTSSKAGDQDNKPLLLIVEDNAEISSFISKSLSNEFRCICAQNGKLGLEVALAHLPDVIVTDIMMPVMDGMEMCRKLKENIATSLTPVVMLTAKDDKNTELLGYRTGADAFIAKPFEIGYLSNRLHQLLRGRNLLVQKARQEAIIQPKEKENEVLSADEKLLGTITQIIENEITNPDLNVNVLSERSGYSLKQIYRRIKSLTGQTAVDYIRSVRLKKAAMLLSRKTFTVAEVMYMVGFNNHSYFAKRFQEMYGKSPKQYSEEDTNNGSGPAKNKDLHG